MKYLCSFILALFCATASAEYRLPFVELQGGVTKLPFVEKEWILGSDRDQWSLYVEKGMTEEKKAIHEFHALTAYKKPYYSEGLKTTISKIYTYGALDCRDGNLYILFEWYVDSDETLIHRSSFEFGAYTVEMLSPDTARNEIYNQICRESI